jgi:hypothetical protein
MAGEYICHQSNEIDNKLLRSQQFLFQQVDLSIAALGVRLGGERQELDETIGIPKA